MKRLSDISHNAKKMIILEPFWALFYGLIFFYAPLYMQEVGLSEIEMGIINTVNLLVAFMCHLFAGPITNKMGRKKTALVFDLISWSIPLLIWAFAKNFWYFLAAAIASAFIRIVGVAWNCLLVEDTPEEKRSKAFSIIYLINYACGVLTPVTGALIFKFGTIPTMRVLYFLGFIGMTSVFIIRDRIIRETKPGMEIMEKHSSMSILESIKSSYKTISSVYNNRSIILITLIYIITNFIISLNFFQILYLKDYLGFSEGIISVTPVVSAFINILLYIFLLPRLEKHTEIASLTYSIAIGSIGALIFLLIPKGNLSVLLVALAFIAVGNFLTQTYRDSVFMNKLGEYEKADVFSAVQTITTLVCIPSGYIGGLTYSINPIFPFIIMLALLLSALWLSFLLFRKNQSLMVRGIDS